MGDAIVWIGRHSLRFDALLQRLRLSATMRVRLAPGTAVDPPSPNDSDPDSNSDTPTSDSAAASHSAAHNPYDARRTAAIKENAETTPPPPLNR